MRMDWLIATSLGLVCVLEKSLISLHVRGSRTLHCLKYASRTTTIHGIILQDDCLILYGSLLQGRAAWKASMAEANGEQQGREQRQADAHREELVERLARVTREDG